MREFVDMLSGGDLRSDGMADEAAAIVLENPEIFDDLYQGLLDPDNVIRGRTSDALEKVARIKPEIFNDRIDELITIGSEDPVPMVRWHLAMIYGHVALAEDSTDLLYSALIDRLEDASIFVRSWSIVSLCILGRLHPGLLNACMSAISALAQDSSIAIRSRVRKAVETLSNEEAPFPAGWLKSKAIDEAIKQRSSR